jgi:FtsZ-binding cell division protein ZapB
MRQVKSVAMQIEGIYVKIGAKISEFQQKLSQVEKKLQETEKKFEGLKKTAEKLGEVGKTLTTRVTAPIVALAGAVTALAVKTGYWADRIGDLTAITGLSEKKIQEWQHVARIAGVEIEAVTRAVEGLIRRLPSLERGSEISSSQLAKLGLTFEDLKKMSPDELVDVLITRLAGLGDTLERNAIASALFGRSWEDIAPILSLGARGIEEAKKEAHELRLVLDSKAIQKAIQFRIQIDRLKGVIDYTFKSIGMAFMPVIEKLSKIFLKLLTPLRKIAEWFENLSEPVQNAYIALLTFVASIGPAILAIKGLTAVVSGLAVALNLLTGPIGLISLLISGIAALGTYIALTWNKVKKILAEMVAFFVEKYALPFLETIRAILKAFSWLPGIGSAYEKLSAKIEEARTQLEAYRQEIEKLKEEGQSLDDVSQITEQSLANLQNQLEDLQQTTADNIQSFDEVHQIMGETAQGAQFGLGELDLGSFYEAQIVFQDLTGIIDTAQQQVSIFDRAWEDLSDSMWYLAQVTIPGVGDAFVTFTEDGIDLQTFDYADLALQELTEGMFELQLATELTTEDVSTFSQEIFDSMTTLESLNTALEGSADNLINFGDYVETAQTPLEDLSYTVEELALDTEASMMTIEDITSTAMETFMTETSTAADTTLTAFEGLYDELVGHSIIPDLVEMALKEWNRLMTGLETKTREGVNKTTNEFLRLRDQVKNALEETMPWLEKFGVDFAKVGRDIESETRSIAREITNAIQGLVEGTMTMKDVFDRIMGGIISILERAMVSILGQIIQNSIAQIGAWLLNVLAAVGQAIGAFIMQAYSALVAFFWWLGPAAPAAAGAVIAGVVAGLGALALKAIGAFRSVVGLAEGGIVTGPTLAVLGEGGKKEAVVPLERDNVIADSVGRAVFEAMTLALRSERVAGQPQESEIVLEIDGKRFARLILPEILSEMKRQGIRLAGA